MGETRWGPLSEEPNSKSPPGAAVILGAGASSVAGAPSMARFQSAAEDVYRPSPRIGGGITKPSSRLAEPWTPGGTWSDTEIKFKHIGFSR